MDLGLQDRVAIVTGATRGIGLAVAQTLASEGAQVAIVARTQTDVTRLADACGGIGVAADLMTHEGRVRAYEETVRKVGPVEIVINNYGARAGRDWNDSGPAEFQRALEGNVGVAAAITSMALPGMLSRGWGRIICVASVFGLEAGGAPAYNAAKAAEIAYIESLASSVSGTGVTANSVAPGPIIYEGGSWDKRMKEDPTATTEFIGRYLPAGRFGIPSEVAAIVCFLCSTQASGVNGACVPVDGAQSRFQAIRA